MGRVVRGVLARRGSTALLLLLAVVAAAAAAAAPAYEQAGRTAILRTTLTGAPPLASQLEVLQATPGNPDPAAAARAVERVLRPTGIFTAPVLTGNGPFQSGPTTYKLVTRTGQCQAVRLVRGRCPTRLGEALESTSDASYHATAGRIGPLTVVGTYAVPAFEDRDWFGQYDVDFPAPGPDALFVTPATLARYSSGGFAVVDIGLKISGLSAGGLAAAARDIDRVTDDPGLRTAGYTSTSLVDSSVAASHEGYSSLAVPTVLVTAELVLLVWLLLALVVADDIEARAPEVALAKLRGLPPRQVVGVAVAEPMAILLVAVPLGALGGRFAARLLADAALGGGIAVGLPALSWLAAAVAVLGGVAAVAAGARRVVRRGVLEQWGRTSQRAPTRGWVLDAVLLTASAAGLLELGLTGAVGSSSRGLQVELVPGLLAIAASVVLSRLLPLGCRVLARATARRGSLAPYLALRQIGRRPGGTRTTIVLASAVAIALFGVAAASVGKTDRQRVAQQTVGAATVLDVTPPGGQDLGAIVDRVDPSGRRATAVGIGYGGSGNTVLAVQPQRFAAIADWSSPAAARAVARSLTPAATPPVVVTGDQIRVVLSSADAAQLVVGVDLKADSGFSSDTLTSGPVGTFAGATPSDCPCTLAGIAVSGPPGEGIQGSLLLLRVQQHTRAGWADLPGATDRWRVPPDLVGSETITVTPPALRWVFTTQDGGEADLESTDVPDPVPAVAASLVGSVGSPTPGTGLDGGDLLVVPVAVTTSVPGAPADGLVVARSEALQVAAGSDVGQQQIWLAAGAQTLIPAFERAGVQILATTTVAGLEASYDHQGPALAGAVLLLDAVVAAGLAALGSTVTLLVAARRRRYEYASLIVGGATRATVWRALVLEQLITLGFALVVGVAAGAAGIALALRKVPVLQTIPTAPPLSYAPGLGVMALALAVATAVILLASMTAATVLVRSVRPGTLRESAP